MSRNFSPYSLSLKSRLTLLFEIYKGFDHVDRSARLAWKFKLLKNITRHYLSKGFTMFFLLTVVASFPYYAKNGQKSQCFTTYNEYKQRQTKYSFFYFYNEANNKIDQPMLENSRLFVGVLSKFPKLRTSIFRIAGQPFIRWMRVIRFLSNLCLNCNHCISIISRIF